MRTPRDVFSYAETLQQIRQLQKERDEKKGDLEVPDLTPEHQKEYELVRAGKLNPLDVGVEVRMAFTIFSMIEQRKHPLYFSHLPAYLEQETWSPKEGVLILAGIDPEAAILDWTYENFMGAQVDSPSIRHANWFSSPSDLYDYPVASDFEYSSREIKGLIKKAEEGSTAAERLELLHRLEEVEKWENDETSMFKRAMLSARARMVGILKKRWDSGDHDSGQRRAPSFFVRWAETRGFEIEWAAWAREHDYLDQEPPVTAAPFFDADAEDYPRLLHIGVRAWEHARQTSGGTAKQRIASFLADRYPDLSGSERDAISMIGNWQKAGGRPRTGG